MNTDFKQLVATSRCEGPPRADVVERVLATLSVPATVSIDRPLQWMASLSAAVALLVIPTLLSDSFFDPLGYWLSSLTVVIQ